MEQNPLVSVVVITYNSAKTVVETLESICQQTYNNIELIVSDDGSKDGTPEAVYAWLEENKSKYVDAKFLTVEKNTGTVKNLNRGIKASKGVWIKSIAGDDCLESNAIERFVDFVRENPLCRFCESDLILFSDNGNVPSNLIDIYNGFLNKASEPLDCQKKRIIRELVFTGPSWFYSRQLYSEIGGFDESFVLMEEWPFILNVLMSGTKIYVLPEKLVRYRISASSVCREKNKGLGNKLLFLDQRRFFYRVRLWYLLKNYMIAVAIVNIFRFEFTLLKYKLL